MSARFLRDGMLWVLEGSGGAVMLRSPDLPAEADSVGLLQSFKEPETSYIFLPSGAPETFAQALESYLARPGSGPSPGLIWISNPEEAIDAWRVARIDVNRSQWTVEHEVAFDFGGYGLDLRGGTGILPEEDGSGLKISAGDGRVAALRTPKGSLEVDGSALQLDFGRSPGCWRFRLDLPAASAGFDLLDCAIRYFRPDTDTGEVHAISFDALRAPGGSGLAFDVRLDPLRPTDPARSRLTFLDAPLLDSGFVTRLGHPIRLRPLATDERPAKLGFHVAASATDNPAGEARRLYLAPEGRFAAESDQHGGGMIPMLCGSTALEYLALRSGSEVEFVPRRPAFADPKTGQLSVRGTTAWLHAAADYFAQPEQAPLFTAGAAGDPRMLSLLEARVARLAEEPTGGLPLVPLRAVAAGAAGAARALERDFLAPARRVAVSGMRESGQVANETAPDPANAVERIGVTRQGLAVSIGADGNWQWLALGHAGAADATVPSLRFTSVRGKLREAFQSSELFMVLGNPAALAQGGSVPYRLVEADFARLRDMPEVADWPSGTLAAVESALRDRNFPLFEDRAGFDGAISAARAATTPGQRTFLAREAGQLQVTIGEWRFRLSSENWRAAGRAAESATYLLVKLTKGRSIAASLGDPSGWGWPEAASPDGADAAAADLRARVADARRMLDDGHEDYRRFVRTIDDPDWSGVLVLSPELPSVDSASLDVLSAGLDGARVGAHHLGFAATQVQLAGGRPVFASSPVFGLIDYRAPSSQYCDEDTAYAFRVAQLTVRIENSAVVDRVCTAELLINRLFGSRCVAAPAEHGANILLTGTYQEQTAPGGGTRGSFAFANRERVLLELPGGGPVESVELESVQLVAPGPGVQASFRMAGIVRFYQTEPFDPFCWGRYYPIAAPAELRDGGLRFANLFLDMRWVGTQRPTFTLRDQSLRFDAGASPARPDSLAARFPARLQRMIATRAAPGASRVTPESLGFANIAAPIEQGKLKPEWYGLVYRIDLGSLGALANSAPLAMEILVAWSPVLLDEGEAPIYLGIKLPGADARLGIDLPLQGLLTLGFKSIEFLVHDPGNAPNSYVLCLRNFAIRLLGLSFPPGRNDIYLFGNPDQRGDQAIGWYAAYAAEGDAAGRAENRLPILRTSLPAESGDAR